jgi:hypothetical protein
MVDAGSSDSCGIAWIEATPSVFSCAHVHEPQTLLVTVKDVHGNKAVCESTAFVINSPPVWSSGVEGMTAVADDGRLFCFFANVTDPEGQNLTFTFHHTCSSDDETEVLLSTNTYSNEAKMEFPDGIGPTMCILHVEVCDVCGSCLIDSSEVRFRGRNVTYRFLQSFHIRVLSS